MTTGALLAMIGATPAVAATSLGATCSVAQFGTAATGLTCARVAKTKYAWVQLAASSSAPVTTKAPTTPTAAGVKTSRANPGPLGAVQVLKDTSNGNVDVLVDSYIADATTQMSAENQFNKPAPEGSRYVLAHVTATYHAGTKKDSGNLIGVEFAVFGTAGVERQSSDCILKGLSTPPDQLDTTRDLTGGGQLSGNVCFLLPLADANGPLAMRASQLICFSDCSEAWFKLQ